MSERVRFFIKGKKRLAKPHHYLASGLDNIFLLNGVTEKTTDYGPMLHIDNINGLHHAIGLHIVEKPELMRGAEFRFLRKHMRLSQAELAEFMGVTDQTVANYEKGKAGKEGFGAADAFMRAFYLIKILPKQTRVGAIKNLLEAAGPTVRRKLSDFPRREIVERWREADDGKAAA